MDHSTNHVPPGCIPGYDPRLDAWDHEIQAASEARRLERLIESLKSPERKLIDAQQEEIKLLKKEITSIKKEIIEIRQAKILFKQIVEILEKKYSIKI